MAKKLFVDSAGRDAYVDDSSGRVYTEGGKQDTFLNVNEWNKRQQDRYSGIGSDTNIKSGINPNLGFDASAVNNAIGFQYANNPEVAAQYSQIGAIKDSYGQQEKQLKGSIKPLQERYQNLIGQITGQGKIAEDRQTLATSRELGRRGVLQSSGLGEREITQALEPITLATQGQISNLGSQQETDMRAIQNALSALPGQQSAEIGAVNSAIASLIQQSKQQEFDNKLAQQAAALKNKPDPIQTALARILEIATGGGTSQASAAEPQFTPVGGDGSISPDGAWIFRGGKWQQNTSGGSTGTNKKPDLNSFIEA